MLPALSKSAIPHCVAAVIAPVAMPPVDDGRRPAPLGVPPVWVVVVVLVGANSARTRPQNGHHRDTESAELQVGKPL